MDQPTQATHQIRTSARRSFRGCRRRWDWAYVQGYAPLEEPVPLEFGRAFHVAMETIYDPRRWDITNPPQKLLAAKDAFIFECEIQRAAYMEMMGIKRLDREQRDDYDERIKLGCGMLGYFISNVHGKVDHWFRPVKVEVEFDVPITNRFGVALRCYNSPACGQVHPNGAEVTHGGRVDIIVEDIIYGGYWAGDWKAQPLDAKVMTPNGFVPMGSLQVGSIITGSDGKPCKVVGVYPQGEKRVYTVTTSDGSKTEATAEHLWKVYRNDNFDKVLTTEDIAWELQKDSPKYVYLPECGPIEFDEKNYNIDPYLLGLLIGDGGFANGMLKFSSVDEELVQEVHTRMPGDWYWGAFDGRCTYNVCGAVNDLRRLGLFGHKAVAKFIPDEYLQGSIEQRLELLRGLMDTDGYVSKGAGKFCTSSIRLAKNVKTLVDSLGGKGTVWQRKKLRIGATHNECVVTVNLPDGWNPFKILRKASRFIPTTTKLRRRIISIEPSRTTLTQCIKVSNDDCLYITDDNIVTHNTAKDLRATQDMLEFDDQICTYCWALRHKLQIDIRGFFYFEIRKAFPEPPKRLSRVTKGCAFSQDKRMPTTAEVYEATVAEHDSSAYMNGFYDPFLEWLNTSKDAAKFHQYFKIPKTDTELKNIGINVAEEAADMVDNGLRIYPSVGRFSCPSCAYKAPCQSRFNDSDYQYTLDTMYRKVK